MATTLTLDHTYAASVGEVFALQLDRAYLHERTRRDGDRNVVVEVDNEVDRFRVRVARDRTLELPAMVRGLFNPTNYTVETMEWRAISEGYIADYAVEARGMPGSVRGSLALLETATGTHYRASVKVVIEVPLIALRLERLMADGFREYLRRNAQRDALQMAAQSSQLVQSVQ